MRKGDTWPGTPAVAVEAPGVCGELAAADAPGDAATGDWLVDEDVCEQAVINSNSPAAEANLIPVTRMVKYPPFGRQFATGGAGPRE